MDYQVAPIVIGGIQFYQAEAIDFCDTQQPQAAVNSDRSMSFTPPFNFNR